MPLHFEVNAGQADADVRFLARGAGYGVGLTSRGAVLSLTARRAPGSTEFDAAVLGLALVGAAPNPRLAGIDPLPGRTHYYRGNEPSKWQTNVATFARVRYEQVYPGIDLVYYGNQGELQYDFHVAPGADPSTIRFGVEGADTIALDAEGNLQIGVAGRTVRQRRPLTYQNVEGTRREVVSRFVLNGRTVRFEIGAYDSSRELVIDPILTYSTWFGGLSQENITDIALDADGNIIVVGHSRGGDGFPATPGAIKSVRGGTTAPGDTFVTKFNPSGSALVFSTLFGGDDEENLASSIAIGGVVADAAGNVIFVGSTRSANFPTTPGADDTTFNEIVAPLDSDGYLTMLSPTGALIYSTYLGGSDTDFATSVAVDSAGQIYVAGITYSSTAEGFPASAATFDGAIGGLNDAFLVRYSSAGVRQYVSYIGGSGSEYFNPNVDVLVDATNVVFVSGETSSTDFPTRNAAQTAQGGGATSGDAFLVKLDTSVNGATGLLYGTYWGGNRDETFAGIARGAAGAVYATGFTRSIDIAATVVPGGATPVDSAYDAVVVKFDTALTGPASRNWALRVGGTQADTASDVGVDAMGQAWIVGRSSSADLPLKNAFDTAMLNTGRPFVAQVNNSGTDTVMLSLAGGRNTNATVLNAVTLNAFGEVYLAGSAGQPGINSNSLELVNPFQSVYGGGPVGTNDGGAYDGVIQKLGFSADLSLTKTASPALPVTVLPGQTLTYTITATNNSPDPAVNVVVSDPLPPQVTFVSCAATGGGVCGGTGANRSVTFTTLAGNTSATITLVTTVNSDVLPGTQWTNTATVGAVTIDPTPGNNAGGVNNGTVPPPQPADVSVKKIPLPPTAAPGETVAFQVTVTNLGPGQATGVIVTDTLPAGLTFVSCAPATGGSCGGAGNARTIEFPTLGVAASSTATIRARVDGNVSPGTTLTNTATVTSGSTDPNPGNNVGTGAVSVLALDPTGDADSDGLNNGFEQKYGLDPLSGSGNDGASADPDGDGRTNLEEQGDRSNPNDDTHPHGFVITYLAEGATSDFFKTKILIANPTGTQALVLTRFQKSDGTTVPWYQTVPAMSRATIDVGTIAGLETAEFSTLVEADVQVVVDRTMTWPASGAVEGYGAHAERGILTRTATTWYLAEGATMGNFDLFYLVQNPNENAASIEVKFLLPSGGPVVKNYTVQGQSRFNIWVDQIPELANAELSAIVRSTNGVPVIVERAMYLSTATQGFGAGHESAGVTTPSTNWFLAEGNTGRFFDLFILVANPNDTAAAVTARYLLQDGTVVTKAYQVAPNSRFNIWVDYEGPELADAAVSTTLTSTNGVPIIVERAMWWPYNDWYEAHNSPGSTETGVKWAMAEGELGGPANTQTYILIANTSATQGTGRVTLLFEDGTAPLSKDFTLPPSSRTNVDVLAEFPAAADKAFGAIVESIGSSPTQVVVERAVYYNAGGVLWAAGSNALATKLQ